MNRERLEDIKKLKNESKLNLKGKKMDRLTQKELNELTLVIAKMLGLIEQ